MYPNSTPPVAPSPACMPSSDAPTPPAGIMAMPPPNGINLPGAPESENGAVLESDENSCNFIDESVM